jgi:HAD superfamily hydrolase (TIGR01509 family)
VIEARVTEARLIEAVVFDMDGVLVDSEQVWDEVRERYAREAGGTYGESATRDMMGMSSIEWSRYMAEQLHVPGTPEDINAAIVERMLERYGTAPPLIPGAVDAVRRCAARWPLAVASSSNPELIEVVLDAASLHELIPIVVSSQEVARGKPAPDVYLEAARRLAVPPGSCAAVEDSHNGIRSAKAAGMSVVAVPNPHFPPDDEALREADLVLHSIEQLTPALIAALGRA